MNHATAAHCRRLSRQFQLRATSFRVRVRPRPCAPACIGDNWDCRVSARQCASVTPARGAPAVGHDVGPGRGRPAGADGGTPSALAALGPTSPNTAEAAGLRRCGQGRDGLGTPPGGTGPRRRREQPRLATEFVSRVRTRGGGVAALSARPGKAATWAYVGEPVANGRGRVRASRRQSDADPTATRRVRPRARRGMRQGATAARSAT